jgi:hypothetical protein
MPKVIVSGDNVTDVCRSDSHINDRSIRAKSSTEQDEGWQRSSQTASRSVREAFNIEKEIAFSRAKAAESAS